MMLGEELSGGGVEEDQPIQGNCDGEVVGQRTVEIAVPWTVNMYMYMCHVDVCV